MTVKWKVQMKHVKSLVLALALAVGIGPGIESPQRAEAANAFRALGGALMDAAVLREVRTLATSAPHHGVYIVVNLDDSYTASIMTVPSNSGSKPITATVEVTDVATGSTIGIYIVHIQGNEITSSQALWKDGPAWTHDLNSRSTAGNDSGNGW